MSVRRRLGLEARSRRWATHARQYSGMGQVLFHCSHSGRVSEHLWISEIYGTYAEIHGWRGSQGIDALPGDINPATQVFAVDPEHSLKKGPAQRPRMVVEQSHSRKSPSRARRWRAWPTSIEVEREGGKLKGIRPLSACLQSLSISTRVQKSHAFIGCVTSAAAQRGQVRL